MILPLRQLHRRMFAAMAVLLPLAFAGGVTARRPVPSVTSLPGQLAPAPEKFAAMLWERSDLFTNSIIRVRLLRETAKGGRFSVQFFTLKTFAKPDLLIYWIATGTKITDTIPDNAFLVGAFNSSVALPLPRDTGSPSGMLVLYSLADHEIVETSKPFSLP